jgi:hypothetical protein
MSEDKQRPGMPIDCARLSIVMGPASFFGSDSMSSSPIPTHMISPPGLYSAAGLSSSSGHAPIALSHSARRG